MEHLFNPKILHCNPDFERSEDFLNKKAPTYNIAQITKNKYHSKNNTGNTCGSIKNIKHQSKLHKRNSNINDNKLNKKMATVGVPYTALVVFLLF